MTAIWLPGEPPPRVAYAVGRSVGNAVTRNLVTRRLRAAVAGLEGAPADPDGEPFSGLADGAWLFRASRDAAERPYEALQRDLELAVRAARQR